MADHTNRLESATPGIWTRRNFLFTSAIVVGSAVLAACGGKGSAPAVGRKVRITYWTPLDHKDTANPRSKAEKAMVDLFRAKYKDIVVDVQAVPWQKMDQQVIQAVAAGKGPDVAQLSTFGLPIHVPAGTLQPLNDWVGSKWSKQEWDDFILPSSNVTYDGQIMGLYWNALLAAALWYRTDLFKEKALPAPKSNDDLTRAAKALTTDRVAGYITGLSKEGNAIQLMNWLIPAMWSAGSDVLDAKGNALFANDKGARPLEWLAEMVHQQKATPPSIVSLTRDQALDSFKAGTAAMAHLTSNLVSTARASGVGKKFELIACPGFEAGTPMPAFMTGKFIAMTKDCKEKEAAGLFIEEMLSPAAQLQNAMIAQELPSRKSVAKEAWFGTPEGADMKIQLDYAAASPHPWQYHPKNNQLADLFAGAAQQIIANKRPVKDALNEVADRWAAELKKG